MRTFIAIPIPQAAMEEVTGLQMQLRKIEPALSWAQPQGFHLTLLFLGEKSPRDVNRIINTLDNLSWPAAFKISLDKLGLFGSIERPKVLWLGLGQGEEQVRSLGGLVRRALNAEEDFAAHLTLAHFRERDATRLAGSLGPLDKSICLSVERVVLFESKLAAGPPRYIPINTWKLEGAEL